MKQLNYFALFVIFELIILDLLYVFFKRLRNNRSGGALRMRAEHIKGWLAASRRAEKGETVASEG